MYCPIFTVRTCFASQTIFRLKADESLNASVCVLHHHRSNNMELCGISNQFLMLFKLHLEMHVRTHVNDRSEQHKAEPRTGKIKKRHLILPALPST